MAKAAEECEAEFLRSQIGKTVSVLVEHYKNGLAEGYSENYTRLAFPYPTDPTGEILSVKVTEAMPKKFSI